MTGFDFKESATFSVPDITNDLSLFNQSDFAESHGLVINIASIHEGLTKNFTFYSEQELEKSLATWTTPYPKPIIVNHDVYTSPLGRAMGARMANEADGTPYINLQAAIKDTEAIQKIADNRFFTGSVGGSAAQALCTICGMDWASRENFKNGLPCKHQRGKVYSGKVAAIHMKDISWKEYSFVNVPADSKSLIKNVDTKESVDGDVIDSLKFLMFDLDNPEIMQLSESSENIDVLASMKKRDVQPMYLGLKGTYLSVTALDENYNENIVISDTNDTNYEEVENNKQETPNMPNKVLEDLETVEEDDVLAVVEQMQEENESEESVEESVEEVDEEIEEDSDSEDSSEQVVEEDAELSEEADAEEVLDKESVDEVSEEEESEVTEDTEVSEDISEEDEIEKVVDQTELTDSEENVDEQPVDELLSTIETLQEENARLRKVVRHNLVEKVVDAKILMGVIDTETRSEAMEEHMGRTASSLADSLRDLATMQPVHSADAPKVIEDSLGVDDDNTIIVDEESVEKVDPILEAENLFVDVLAGRKKL